MKLSKTDVDKTAIESIAKILNQHFQVTEQIEGVYTVSTGGVNDANHRVVRTVSGKQYGMKTKTRGGGQEGEKREAAFSQACSILKQAEACRAVCVDKIAGLPGFDKNPCVVTEWVPDSKRAGEIAAEEKKELANDNEQVLHQVGKWVGTNLLLGLADRGALKNWVWSHKDRRLAAIDTESAFSSATVQDHRSIIDTFYDRVKLKQERGSSAPARAFERG